MTAHLRGTNHPDPFDNAYAFYVYWSRNHGAREKACEMEEVILAERLRDGPLVLLRYMHSIRDPSIQAFTHCDGAVRAYSRESYALRSTETMPTRERASHRRKVFRVDGRLDTDLWSETAALWFRGNWLTVEYLASLGDGEVQHLA